MDYSSIIINLNLLFVLVNSILFLQRFQILEKPLKIISTYLVVITILQFVTRILSVNKIDNLYLSHVYFIFQFITLSWFFLLIVRNQRYKIVLKLLIGLVLLFLIVEYSISPEKIRKFNLTEIILCSLPIVLHSVVFFFQSIENSEKKLLYLNSGIFVYLLCSTLIFVAGNYVSPKQTFWYQFIWVLNAFLYLIYMVLIFIEWYKHFRKKEIVD